MFIHKIVAFSLSWEGGGPSNLLIYIQVIICFIFMKFVLEGCSWVFGEWDFLRVVEYVGLLRFHWKVKTNQALLIWAPSLLSLLIFTGTAFNYIINFI